MSYFISIFLGTFVLEDLALATGLALMNENKIGFETAFLACFLGISVGDIGLYFIGYLVSRFNFDKKYSFFKKYRATISKIKRSQALSYSIVISRILPGTRLPTYLASGYLRYPFINFFILTLISVFLWVFIALSAGKSLHYLFMDHWLLSLIIFVLALHFIKTLVSKLTDTWERKALIYSWQRWLYFEFWPASLFYLPLVPYYIYLSVKYKSALIPFYANPNLKHGGLIGESKWDLLKHLNPADPSTLKSIKIHKDIDFIKVKELLQTHQLNYPLIIKPDVGQRGFGVRIIRNDFDLTEYLLLSHFECIIQSLSPLPCEAGVFYIKEPHQKKGYLFSITDKKFPFVVGDGTTQLGDLILKDQRARIIASVYFERLRDQLNNIPLKDEVIFIAECGNHCQGAIFLDGNYLNTNLLTDRIDSIAQQIPDFYFGRFDIRYKDTTSLSQGLNFQIVEINGSGAEATHIWDAKTKLSNAYLTLFKQWNLLFKIGYHLKQKSGKMKKVDLALFIKDCAKVALRKESLSVSS